ncbi:hypothetical protein [Dyadobacter sandarakinus]|uniref:Uncharacterized protein n=1 Tax=Dyadobacter sandarakinus TaxID=2747268 RepID=A0ABX7I396_9BACT|nr:hypothetical protein [Dyadobacter sandarakinus]QRR00022.1 hypothetical protein HWI92_03365 [Dyadobacter sandarakinus]
MKVIKIGQDPSNEEIAQALAQEFSSGYSYKSFGLGNNKSIIVRKSEFVGAQISKSGKQITVHAHAPNVLLSLLDVLYSGIISVASYSSLKELESDLVVFLKNKYA